MNRPESGEGSPHLPCASDHDGPEFPAVDVRALRVVLGEQPVLRGVNLDVAGGTRLALVGPNGAGKSTLLRVLAGLLRPESGEVVVCGHTLASDPWRLRRSVGLVGHHAMLHPDLTARENLAVYAKLYGLDRAAERVEDGLRAVALTDRAGSRAATLSRGMLQRLTLARALLHDPSVLLLDEAETGLDARARDVLAATLDHGSGNRGSGDRTVLLASHDLAYVHEVADEIAFMRAGRIIERVRTRDLDAASLRQRYAEVLDRRPAPRVAPVRLAAAVRH
jgi:heme exporter protein A